MTNLDKRNIISSYSSYLLFMKKRILIGLSSIILLWFFAVRNYQQTEFEYIYDIRDWFFVDTWRVVVVPDQFNIFRKYMSGDYNLFIQSLGDTDTNLRFEFRQTLLSWNNGKVKSFIEQHEQYIANLEQQYLSGQIIQTLKSMLTTGQWWDMSLSWDLIDILRDPPINTSKLNDHLIRFTAYHCNKDPSSNTCLKYQTMIVILSQKMQRRSGIISELVVAVNLDRFLKGEQYWLYSINPHLKLITCSKQLDFSWYIRQVLMDEYYWVYLKAINSTIKSMKEGSGYRLWLPINSSLENLMVKQHTDKLIQKLNQTLIQKLQQVTMMNLYWQDPKQMTQQLWSHLSRTRFAIWLFQGNLTHEISDFISNILVDTLVSDLDFKIIQQHLDFNEYCDTR